MRKRRFSLPSKYMLLFLALICIAFVVISYFTGFPKGPVNTVAGYVISPIQKGITSAGNWLEDKFAFFQDKEELINENKELQAKVDELTLENTTLKGNSHELERLRQLYELDNQYSAYPKVAASVIAKDTGNWFHNFIIDKGTKDGVDVDMNVIANGGLVGKVVAVGNNWARVRSIIDDSSSVSAMTQTTGDYCIISGNLELLEDGVISMSKLYDTDDNVKVGEMIVTSNISETYLPGLLIGYLSDVQIDSNNMTKSGEISLVVDFEHIREVFVITQKKQQ